MLSLNFSGLNEHIQILNFWIYHKKGLVELANSPVKNGLVRSATVVHFTCILMRLQQVAF